MQTQNPNEEESENKLEEEEMEPEESALGSVGSSSFTTSDKMHPSKIEEISHKSEETIPAINSYQIKPTLLGKFKAEPVKEIIRNVLTEILGGKSYDRERIKKWAIDITSELNSRVRELNMKRYKFVNQVILGEYKGAAVKTGLRCVWDLESDAYASDFFLNDTIFCLAVVYGIYFY